MQFIQAEFCHTEGDSPEEVAINAMERLAEGSRYKQVVRFTDEIGKIVELIQRICELRNVRERYFHKLEAGNPILFHGFRIDRLIKKIKKKEAHLHGLMLHRMGYAEIAIEDRPGDPFRTMQEEERYELCLAANKANSHMIFLMEGELLSDKVEVTHSIIA